MPTAQQTLEGTRESEAVASRSHGGAIPPACGVWEQRRVRCWGRVGSQGSQGFEPSVSLASPCAGLMTSRKSTTRCHGGELRGGGGHIPETRQCQPFVFTAVITCSGVASHDWGRAGGRVGRRRGRLPPGLENEYNVDEGSLHESALALARLRSQPGGFIRIVD